MSNCFPDEKGYRVDENREGKITWHLQDSDVVCFRSAPADAFFYRSMVPISESGIHLLPPHAIVTLEKVERPGEWEVCGHRVQQRLLKQRLVLGGQLVVGELCAGRPR